MKGAEIPPPFGGKYRQVMVYVDPYKLSSRQLSPMDVVDAVNQSNLILPAGDVKMGPYDYYVYSNSLVDNMEELNEVPIKTVGHSWVTVGDVGKAEDANQIQYNMVRVDGQRSAYIPIMKQGGDTNTIEVVNGVRELDRPPVTTFPSRWRTSVVFDQSVYRQGSHQDGAARRLHRTDSDQHHDSDLSGQLARHFGGVAFHSALRPGHVRGAVPDGQHREHHDSGRAGAGLFARDRQFGDLAGKHLSPPGDGRRARWSPRRWAGRK